MKNTTEGIGRRQFLSSGSAALLGATVGGIQNLSGMERSDYPLTSENGLITSNKGSYKDMLRDAVRYKKIDAHNHNSGNFLDQIESMDRLGIKWAAISDLEGKNTPENFRKSNDTVLKAMKQYPGRFLGQCRINPGYSREAIAEIDRCIDNGMVMLGELYAEYKLNDPVYYPIFEHCIKLKIPILVHSATILGLWRPGYPTVGSDINTSITDYFVEMGRRYPEAMLICGHIGGGGDWEYVCRVLRDAPSVYLDTSGSVTDEAMLDLAVENIGVDRLLFGTDVNYETGVGKIMCAKLTENERKKIFFDNFNNLLKKRGNNVD